MLIGCNYCLSLFVMGKGNEFNEGGMIFCYFSFLIYSGLFLYINGVFVVMVNRCCL